MNVLISNEDLVPNSYAQSDFCSTGVLVPNEVFALNHTFVPMKDLVRNHVLVLN